ncbi:MAG: formate dehydrogenase accessory sulfurtransferase FdhD [Myxococcales bacterium]|nr:formate dehydrogenase accessory sulfurtransferase FdhD [Myxococcales bacterium]MCB9643917.1 formate dehydrogenase accessory sulfurtransferase FdhD [Myxococcales bacterium]
MSRHRHVEKFRVCAVREEEQVWRSDTLVVEEPLEIRLQGEQDGVPFVERIAVTMRTPGDDFALAAGFLWGEGILSSSKDIESISYCVSSGTTGILDDEHNDDQEEQQYNVVTVRLRAGLSVALEQLRRRVYTTSSCGVCGKASLEAIEGMMCWPTKVGELEPWTIEHACVWTLPLALQEAQKVFAKTGGLHAAGLFLPDGQMLCVREDVGRHNAVDKVIGSSLLAGSLPLSSCGLVVSGRASFELVQKALMAGIPMLVAVGAPSNLAVRLARQQEMTLVGFAREQRFNVYAGHARVVKEKSISS